MDGDQASQYLLKVEEVAGSYHDLALMYILCILGFKASSKHCLNPKRCTVLIKSCISAGVSERQSKL